MTTAWTAKNHMTKTIEEERDAYDNQGIRIIEAMSAETIKTWVSHQFDQSTFNARP